MKGKSLTMRGRSRLVGMAFFTPWLLGFLLFTLYPLLYSVVISFCDVRIRVGGTELSYLGFAHYSYAFTQDAAFPTALLNSLFLMVTGFPIVVVFSLVVALLLNRRFHGRAFFRAVFFLPVIIISGPVLTQLVEETDAMRLNMNLGILRQYMWALTNRQGAMYFTLFMDNLIRTLWFSGVQTLIFLAAMQKIDTSMYEAASIDGATGWEMFWRITLPFLRPTVVLNAVYTIVEMSSVSSDPTNIKIMDHLLEVNRPYSYSASMAWIWALAQLLVIGLAVLVLAKRERRRA